VINSRLSALRTLLAAAVTIAACVPAPTVPAPPSASTAPAAAISRAARPEACSATAVPPSAPPTTTPGPLPPIPADVDLPAFWMAVCGGLGGPGFEDDFSYDGAVRARVDVRFGSIPGQSDGSFMVFDGTRVLMYDAASNSYAYPNLAPRFSAFSLITDVSWAAFQRVRGCDPAVVGSDRILGSDVVRVRCGSADLWVAPENGLILRTVDGPRRLEAGRLEVRPTLPADYFNADPPPGAQAR
jgi:hypothetical protein